MLKIKLWPVNVEYGEFAITPTEWEYMQAYCISGMTISDIARYFETSRCAITKALKSVRRKLSLESNEDLLDWYHNRFPSLEQVNDDL